MTNNVKKKKKSGMMISKHTFVLIINGTPRGLVVAAAGKYCVPYESCESNLFT